MGVHTSTGELQRVAIDALRGLGFSFALTDRVARTLTWAEAVHQLGGGFLRLNEERIRRSAGNSFRVSYSRNGEVDVVLLDAAGMSLFESGPRALDLANAIAIEHGAGLVLVKRTFGSFMLGEFIMHSMERNLGAFALVWPDHGSEGDFDVPRAILGLPGRGCLEATKSYSVRDDFVADREQMFELFWPIISDFCSLEKLEKPQWFFEKPRSGRSETSKVLLLSFATSDDGDRLARLGKVFEKAALSAGSWAIDDLAQRWKKAVKNGFEVDPTDWQTIFSLVARTRVPTSERSSTQAG